jgi:hypothetical protein
MKNKIIYSTLIFILFVISSCQKEQILFTDQFAQSSSIEFNKKVQKPFKGSLISYPVEGVSLECNCEAPLKMSIAGFGNITQMGNTTTEGVSCATPTEYGFFIDGCVSLVAANGDEVFAQVDPYGLYIDLNCFCKATGTTTGYIVGGTGRFSGATGEALITVTQEFTTNKFTAAFDGYIIN